MNFSRVLQWTYRLLFCGLFFQGTCTQAHDFSLSSETERAYGLKTQVLEGPGPWKIPESAYVHSLDRRGFYRVRQGKYAWVSSELAQSEGLKIGDALVIQGAAFLRLTELALEEGAPEGHGH